MAGTVQARHAAQAPAHVAARPSTVHGGGRGSQRDGGGDRQHGQSAPAQGPKWMCGPLWRDSGRKGSTQMGDAATLRGPCATHRRHRMPAPFCRDPALAQLRQALAERAAGHFWIPINPPGRSVGPTDPGAPARAGISGRADRAAPSARQCTAAVRCTEGHRRAWLPLRPDGRGTGLGRRCRQCPARAVLKLSHPGFGPGPLCPDSLPAYLLTC